MTTTPYVPASAVATAGIVSAAAVAPATSTPFFCHWYDSGGVPVAVTVSVKESPEHGDWAAGCDTIVTGSAIAIVAGSLVTEPQPLVTTTS